MAEQGKISFFSAVLMSINIIVGSFIFVAPQRMAVMAGSMSFLSWVLAGILLLPIVLIVAQAARVFPGEGGFYLYCKTGLNETAGFLSIWAYLLGYLGTAGTITVIIRERLVSQAGISAFEQHPYLFYAGFIILLSLLNLLSIELISKIQSFVTLLKLTPLFIVAGLIIFYWNPTITYSASNLAGLGATLPLAFFGFYGFESCCSISHMIKGGSTQASRVMLLAFGVTVVLYTIYHLGVLNMMGTDNLIAFGSGAFPNFLGLSPYAAESLMLFIACAIMLSLLNTTYGAALTNITNLATLSSQRSILGARLLAKRTSNGTPINAVILHGIVLFALVALIGHVTILNSITNFGVGTAILLVLVTMIAYNAQRKNILMLLITCAGMCSLTALFYYSWLQAGDDTAMRFLYLTPFLVGFPAGWIMYKTLKCCKQV